MSKHNDSVQKVIDLLEDANYLVQSELHDAKPERAQEIAYAITDVVDRVACMEDTEQAEEHCDDPMEDFNYVGHPAHY